MRENRYCCPGKWVVLIAYRQSETDLVGKTIALQAGSIAGVRILVVEDNELNMEIAEYMFIERGAVVEKAAAVIAQYVRKNEE